MPQHQSQRERSQAESQREPAGEPLLLRGQTNDHQGAEERHECQEGEQREARS